MRLAKLADETGVSTATLKYYLREGLLHAGTPESRSQSSYDDSHVSRVRLVRALVTSGGLSLARAKTVIDSLEDPPESRHDLLGVAQQVLGPAAPHEPSPQWRAVAEEFVRHRGWTVDPEDDLVAALATHLEVLVSSGVAVGDTSSLDRWADACEIIATADLSTLPEDPPDALRQVVTGTVLSDPIILTLRRLAQQDESARRFT